MSLQLQYEEEFSTGLKRLIMEEVDAVLTLISEADNLDKKHLAVHETRKSFKKIRALLRLIRDNISFYRKENHFFRNQARSISEMRDASSNLEALELLKEQYSTTLEDGTFDLLKQRLEEYRTNMASEVLIRDLSLEKIAGALISKRKEIESWDLNIDTFFQFQPGIQRVYKRGLKLHRKCEQQGTTEQFHEWRKRMKYLRYQLDVLNRMWPKTMGTMENELHDLTNLTGFDHDLFNLHECAMSLENAFVDHEEQLLFQTLLTQQRDYLRKHALLKGRKFFTDSPEKFTHKLKVFWETHKEEVTGTLPQQEKLEY